MLTIAIIMVLSYLIGSIPTSLIVSKSVLGIDIREHGSGNAGGTNVFRVMGWKYGVLVILLDTLKGIVAVLLVAQLYGGVIPFENTTPFEDFTLVQILAGLSAVIGHVWTIFANFRGGKGIATALGMLMIIITIDMLVAIGVFLLVVGISRYVSLGSITAALSIPLTLIIRENIFHVDIPGYYTILPFVGIVVALVIYTHRKNIRRLIEGSESKISFSKKS